MAKSDAEEEDMEMALAAASGGNNYVEMALSFLAQPGASTSAAKQAAVRARTPFPVVGGLIDAAFGDNKWYCAQITAIKGHHRIVIHYDGLSPAVDATIHITRDYDKIRTFSDESERGDLKEHQIHRRKHPHLVVPPLEELKNDSISLKHSHKNSHIFPFRLWWLAGCL